MKGYPSIFLGKDVNNYYASRTSKENKSGLSSSTTASLNPIKFRVSLNQPEDLLNGIANSLHFFLAKYDINGTFYGFEEMKNQLFICDTPSEEVNKVYQVGNTMVLKC